MGKTYEDVWASADDAYKQRFGGDKAKAIQAMKDWNAKQEGIKELKSDVNAANPTKKLDATDNRQNNAMQNTVNATNNSAIKNSGTGNSYRSESLKDAAGNVIINQTSNTGGRNRSIIHKAGSAEAERIGEGSTTTSSSVNPDTEYGKYKTSMLGSGKETHGGMHVGGMKGGDLKTGMGYAESSTTKRGKRKEEIYNAEGDRVAVTKRGGGKGKVRLTRAGKKDADTTLTKKSGRVVGAPKEEKVKKTARQRKSDRLDKKSKKSFEKYVEKHNL